jgi:hypothetical protein
VKEDKLTGVLAYRKSKFKRAGRTSFTLFRTSSQRFSSEHENPKI